MAPWMKYLNSKSLTAALPKWQYGNCRPKTRRPFKNYIEIKGSTWKQPKKYRLSPFPNILTRTSPGYRASGKKYIVKKLLLSVYSKRELGGLWRKSRKFSSMEGKV